MKLWLKEKNKGWKFYEKVVPSDLELRDIKISDKATVGDWARVGDGATVGDWARVGDWAMVGYKATVGDGAMVGDWAMVGYKATVGDGAMVGDKATVGDGATVGKTIDCIVLGPIGSRESMLTGYFVGNEIFIGTGCFYGSIEKFRRAVKEKHGGKKFEQDYLAALVYIEARLNIARADKLPAGGVR